MKRTFIIAVIGSIVAAIFATSCSSVPKMSEPVTSFEVSQFNTGVVTSGEQALENFEITVPIRRYFGIPAGPAWKGNENVDTLVRESIDTEIARQGGTQAINVSIGYEAKLTDFMLNGLTGFIYAPSTVRIRGSVIK